MSLLSGKEFERKKRESANYMEKKSILLGKRGR